MVDVVVVVCGVFVFAGVLVGLFLLWRGFVKSAPGGFVDGFPLLSGGVMSGWGVGGVEGRVPRVVLDGLEFGVPGGGLGSAGFGELGVVGARGELGLWRFLRERGLTGRVGSVWSASKPWSGGDRRQGDIDVLFVVGSRVFVVDAKLWRRGCVVRCVDAGRWGVLPVLCDGSGGRVVGVRHDVGNMADACVRVRGLLDSWGVRGVDVVGRVVVMSEDGSTRVASDCFVSGGIPVVGVDVFVRELVDACEEDGRVDEYLLVALAQLAGDSSWRGQPIV